MQAKSYFRYLKKLVLTTSKIFEPNLSINQFSLSPDPQQWGSDLSPDLVEPDDDIHTPKERSDEVEIGGHVISIRGVTNLGCLIMLCAGILALLYVSHIIYH